MDKNNIEYEFHDFKKLGVSETKLNEWASKLGWEPLVNKRGTTWKQLEPDMQKAVNSKAEAFKLMQAKTSVIKRPVIETDGELFLGFDEVSYRKLFGIT